MAETPKPFVLPPKPPQKKPPPKVPIVNNNTNYQPNEQPHEQYEEQEKFEYQVIEDSNQINSRPIPPKPMPKPNILVSKPSPIRAPPAIPVRNNQNNNNNQGTEQTVKEPKTGKLGDSRDKIVSRARAKNVNNVQALPSGLSQNSNIEGNEHSQPTIPPRIPQKLEETKSEKKEETEDETRSRFRQLVINELVETEETYVEDISLIILMFVYPIRSSSTITMEEQIYLFSNIELVLDANKDILQEMQKLKDQSVDKSLIGHIFSKRVEYFVQVYTHYCLNQTNSMSTYESLMKKNSKFKAFTEKMQQDPRCKQLDIMSFLVKPVQRVCKYPLLLRELLKYTPEDHPDYQDLIIAMDKMNDLLALVNQSSRESRNLEMIMQVEASLTGANHIKLIIPGRKFIRSGVLTKISGKNIQERQFFLFNDMLIYAKHHLSAKIINQNAKQYDFKGLIPLNALLIRDLPDTDNLKNAIELWRIDLMKKYIVYTDAPETKADWLKDIEQQKVELEASESKPSKTDDDEKTANVAFQMGTDDGSKGKNSLKMAELESRIVGFKSFVKHGKKFLKEGALTIDVNGENKPKSRYVFLFDDYFLITKKISEKIKKGLQLKDDIPFENGNILIVDVEDQNINRSSFSLIRMDTKTKYSISCPDERAKETWLELLKNHSLIYDQESSNSSNTPVINTPATPPVNSIPALRPSRPTRAFNPNNGLAPGQRFTIMTDDIVKHISEKLHSDPMAPILSPRAYPAKSPSNNNSAPNNNSTTTQSPSQAAQKTCYACFKQFQLQRPKRVCKNCLNSFCPNCSSKKRPLAAKNITIPARVCDKCFLTA